MHIYIQNNRKTNLVTRTKHRPPFLTYRNYLYHIVTPYINTISPHYPRNYNPESPLSALFGLKVLLILLILVAIYKESLNICFTNSFALYSKVERHCRYKMHPTSLITVCQVYFCKISKPCPYTLRNKCLR